MPSAKLSQLTREELSEFLHNPRTLRVFEQLFSYIPREDEYFRGEIDAIKEEIDVIKAGILDLDITKLVFVITNHIMDTNAYTVVVGATGLTLTLPKCSSNLLGRTWVVVFPIAGTVIITTQGGDIFPTPDSPIETTVELNRRGSTIEMICASDTTWGFS